MTDGAISQDAPRIPDKLYFRIREVSALLGIEPHVLRFWETEFRTLTPKKAESGHRLYRRKDVELLFQIKYLLYEKRYTIEGARQMLQTLNEEARKPRVVSLRQPTQGDLFDRDPLPSIRKELAAILEIL